MNILITGGAGFIGSFLTDQLIQKGHHIRILDNLEEQVHHGIKPKYLNKKAQFVKGDIRNQADLKKAIKGVDAIYHLAAAVGVGQSNYQIYHYTDTNILGTANLLNLLANYPHSVKKVIVAASMSGLGEGNYHCPKDGTVRPGLRTERQLKQKKWEPICPKCAGAITAIPTDEQAIEYPNSFYAIGKKVTQDMALLYGQIYGRPTVALKFFNVYGPRQSLSNPYTGVTAIFISRIKNDQPATVYEDGLQSRDFVSVHDVVDSLTLALASTKANGHSINIGSGRPTPIKEVAEILAHSLGKDGLVTITQSFRKGDTRHCYSDITKAKTLLNWQPKVNLEQGFQELVDWSADQEAKDGFKAAEQKLRQKGIL